MKIVEGKTVYSVSEVNSQARVVLEQMSFWVEGELSSFKGLNEHYRYLYFSLKDPKTGAILPCLLEPEIYHSLNFDLTDGQKVLALGNLTLFERDGRFQMYIHDIRDFGEGELLAEFEKLKKKLQEKGYFDEKNKKALPKFPTNIAVISSEVSDAWQDFKKHTVDRFGIISLAFYDVMVQGASSAAQIIKAIKVADKKNYDAIIIIRGGGSVEDLASYNDEGVADTIFQAKTPIIVGVGHEKDITIAQLIADVGASTPTDAAKIITADFVNVVVKLEHFLRLMKNYSRETLANYSQELDINFHKLAFQKEKFQNIPRHLDFLKQSLMISQGTVIVENNRKLSQLLNSLSNTWNYAKQNRLLNLKSVTEKLSILSPEKTLGRGYSFVTNFQNKIVKDAQTLVLGEEIRVKFAKGRVLSKVLQKEN